MVSGAGAIAGGLAPLVSTAANAVRGWAGPWALIGAPPTGAFAVAPAGEAGRRQVRIPAIAPTATIAAKTGRKRGATDRDRRGEGGAVAGALIGHFLEGAPFRRWGKKTAPLLLAPFPSRRRRVNNALTLSAPKSSVLADHAGPNHSPTAVRPRAVWP
jgi:hypothetical protein